ncbi:MAG: 3-dehydroquinate synthase [Proteobacteria bacterium]|nr:3-dehydroquinate synthase [Pseudomonadota bacterium]
MCPQTNFDTPFGLSSESRVNVDLGPRSYPIHIGTGLLERAPELIKEILGDRRCLIVTDTTVQHFYGTKAHDIFTRAGLTKDDLLVMPTGEQTKNFSYLSFVLDNLFMKSIDRRTVLVALGGGVIGDLTGFVAAIALRGLDFVQIPTTLLSQVDSAVGGKTGINSPRGKNLIGAFHQPRLVIVDVDTLKTLPTREVKSGYAEVVKYGLLGNASFFRWLEKNGPHITAGKIARQEIQVQAIRTACAMKAFYVTEDEKDLGKRALLNLGHTFAHAFETLTNYDGSILHGEAVAMGLVKAFQLSHRLGFCPPADVERVVTHLKAMGLPTSLSGRGWPVEHLITTMFNDKKVMDGELTFVLVRGIGEAFVENKIATVDVRAVLEMP